MQIDRPIKIEFKKEEFKRKLIKDILDLKVAYKLNPRSYDHRLNLPLDGSGKECFSKFNLWVDINKHGNCPECDGNLHIFDVRFWHHYENDSRDGTYKVPGMFLFCDNCDYDDSAYVPKIVNAIMNEIIWEEDNFVPYCHAFDQYEDMLDSFRLVCEAGFSRNTPIIKDYGIDYWIALSPRDYGKTYIMTHIKELQEKLDWETTKRKELEEQLDHITKIRNVSNNQIKYLLKENWDSKDEINLLKNEISHLEKKNTELEIELGHYKPSYSDLIYKYEFPAPW